MARQKNAVFSKYPNLSIFINSIGPLKEWRHHLVHQDLKLEKLLETTIKWKQH